MADQSTDLNMLLTQLAEAKEAQLRLQHQVEQLMQNQAEHSTTETEPRRSSLPKDEEDLSEEVGLLRTSLATLASQLASEKERADAAERAARDEQEKVQTLRSKVEESRRALMQLQTSSDLRRNSAPLETIPSSRRSSFSLLNDQSTIGGGSLNTGNARRKSSLGMAAGNSLSGLGLGVENGGSANRALASPLSGTRSNSLVRLAHRKSATNLGLSIVDTSTTPSSPAEDERLAKLRELRLGQTSTKIASRRSSEVVADGALGSLEIEYERRASLQSQLRAQHAIYEEPSAGDQEDLMSMPGSLGSLRPPSAPLRVAGRKDSVPVFAPFYTRRESTDSIGSAYYGTSARRSSDLSEYGTPDDIDEYAVRLRLEVEGLRIQLAEAEEGRRASEACLQALKEYIVTTTTTSDSNGTEASNVNLKLPPLPTETGPALSPPMVPSKSASSSSTSPSLSRWNLGLLGSIGRKASTASRSSDDTAAITAAASRRPSVATNASKTTPKTSSAPSFSSFSFFALADKNASTVVDYGETSPTMNNNMETLANTNEADSSSFERGRESEEDETASLSEEPSLSFDSSASETSSSLRSRSTTPEHEDIPQLGAPNFESSEKGFDARRVSVYEDAHDGDSFDEIVPGGFAISSR